MPQVNLSVRVILILSSTQNNKKALRSLSTKEFSILQPFMSMRAATSLYVHPELTDSEVWDKPSSSVRSAPAAGRISKAAVFATVATISLAAASAFTIVKTTGIGKLIRER